MQTLASVLHSIFFSLKVESIEEFQTLCFEADLCPYRFVYTSIDGEEVELCKDGANIAVT